MSGIDLQESETRIWVIVQAVLQLAQGRSNAVGEVTLAASATETVVDKDVSKAAVNVGMDAEVFISARTASARAAPAYVSSVGQGTFTITHDSAPATDRTFGWVALG